MIMGFIVPFAYLVATVLFIFSLRWMNDPRTARQAVYAGVVAMLIAVGATWIEVGTRSEKKQNVRPPEVAVTIIMSRLCPGAHRIHTPGTISLSPGIRHMRPDSTSAS